MPKLSIGVSKEYQWKETSASCGVSPQVFGDHVEAMAEHYGGEVTPQELVDSARPPDSPIHCMFEWRDDVAAEQWRTQQARMYVCNVVIVNQPENDDDEPVRIRAFSSIRTEERRGYMTTAAAMTDPEKRRQVIENAQRDARIFAKKHGHLKELAKVVAAVDEFVALPLAT